MKKNEGMHGKKRGAREFWKGGGVRKGLLLHGIRQSLVLLCTRLEELCGCMLEHHVQAVMRSVEVGDLDFDGFALIPVGQLSW